MKKNNNVKNRILRASAGLLLAAFFFIAGCGGNADTNSDLPDRAVTPVVLTPEASGTETLGNDKATVDVSNISDGYVMVKYDGDNPKVKLRVTSQKTYDYDLSIGKYEAFPLNEDSGTYKFEIYESIPGEEDKYTLLFSGEKEAVIDNPLLPYLYPNQYVDFNAQTKAVTATPEIVQGSKTDMDVIEKVYHYVTNNFAYDYDKAGVVESGYLPVLDEVWDAKKGICFDYAAVMTAMLRTQDIPAKLVIGYVDTNLYHAWLDVYTEEEGWIDNAIYFDGDDWSLMDPTLASTGEVNYEDEGSLYSPMYYY